MSGPVRLSVPPHLIDLVGRDAPRGGRLSAARGEVPLPPEEEGVALLVLASDPDEEIRAAARQRVREMEGGQASALIASAVHPLVVELFRRLRKEPAAAPSPPDSSPPLHESLQRVDDLQEEEPLPEAFHEEEMSVEFRSKYQLAQRLGVSEKIKYALTGDKEWRSILIRDSNKQVSGAVIKNPRITDAEVLAICKSAIQNDEVIRIICQNREWVKNYQIRKALVENPRTPLAHALRFLGGLGEKDLAALAKSRNISSVITAQARRLLMQKKKD